MPVKYQLGKIYKIVNNVNNIIYIGSTCQKRLSSRLSSHRREAIDRTSKWNIAMRTTGVQNFTIVLVHAFPCQSKDELEAEEYRVLDATIAAGIPVYNSIIAGKANAETKTKMSLAQKGENNNNFQFGSLTKHSTHGKPKSRWIFAYVDSVTNKRIFKSFSIAKYGEYGAHWRAEEIRKQVYPEYGTEEDCTCDDFGEIEWD